MTSTSPKSPARFWVKFWGVRGSVPAPGPDTVRYGGNTSCIEVRCGEERFVLDGGTGVRPLGDSLRGAEAARITFLMTHLHLDHVQGFPFFAPFLVPGYHFDLYSALHNGAGLEDVLSQLLSQPAFPISLDMFAADLTFRELQVGGTLDFGALRIRTTLLNHPGGVVGYRFEFGERSYVHCSDWEHPLDGSLDPVLVNFIQGADLLSIDAMYTEAEYLGRSGSSRKGWGHATHDAAIRHAEAEGVRQTLLFHHDPARTDAELDAIAATQLVGRPAIRFVREGEAFDL